MARSLILAAIGTLAILLGLLPAPAPAAPLERAETIRHAALQYLEQQVAGTFKGRHQVTMTQLDPRLRLGRCTGPLAPFLAPGSRLRGNTTVGVRCSGEPGWTIYLSGNIELFGKVLMLSRPLPRGAHVQPGDLVRSERDLARLPYGYITDPTDAVGRVLTRPLASGTILTPSMLSIPALVKRGDQVTLLAEAAGLQVRMAGEAIGSAGRGQKVQVRALSSGRLVEGVVISPGVVKVTL